MAITGDLDLRLHAAPGTASDAEVLAAIDLDRFYASDGAERQAAITPPLAHRHVTPSADLEKSLYASLETFAPLGLLVNMTMKTARPVANLGAELFPDAPDLAARTVTTLLALGSVARQSPRRPACCPAGSTISIAAYPTFGSAWIPIAAN